MSGFLLLFAALFGMTFFFDSSSTEPEPDIDNGSETPPEEVEEDPLPILGNESAEALDGNTANDSIRGNGGDDTLRGLEGDDSLFGGAGDDRLVGDTDPRGFSGGGADSLEGGAGNDTLFGNGGLDTLQGGEGDDLLIDQDTPRYGPNATLADGGAGDDLIRVDGGSTVTGGEGADTIQIHADVDEEGVTEITDFEMGVDTLGFDIFVGADQNGPLTINDSEDGTGANLFLGDTLVAEIAGGQGLSLDDLDIRLILSREAGAAEFTDGDEGSYIIDNDSDNIIRGNGGDDTIYAGGPFGNLIGGGGGSDVLLGGAGDDWLSGNGTGFDPSTEDGPRGGLTDETDTLVGGAGDDTLIAENGGDLLGGEGDDVFAVFQDIRNVASGAVPTPVQINDYTPGEDIIYIELLNGYGGRADAEITIETADGGHNILSNGVVIAQVAGQTNLTLENLVLNRVGPFASFL